MLPQDWAFHPTQSPRPRCKSGGMNRWNVRKLRTVQGVRITIHAISRAIPWNLPFLQPVPLNRDRQRIQPNATGICPLKVEWNNPPSPRMAPMALAVRIEGWRSHSTKVNTNIIMNSIEKGVSFTQRIGLYKFTSKINKSPASQRALGDRICRQVAQKNAQVPPATTNCT